MRLPAWIESYGSAGTSSAGPATTNTPAVQTDTSPATPANADLRGPGAKVVADWSDLKPVAAPAAKPAARAPAPPATTPSLVEAGGFRRWINERVATLPKPADLVKPAPAKEPVTEATAQSPKGEASTGESSTPAAPTDPADAGAPSATEAATPKPIVTAPIAATPDEMPTLSIDPASFRGALPGKTTRAQIEAEWGAGEAFARPDGGAGLSWKIDPFDRVEATIDADVVSSISIKLAEPVPVADLARQLEISDLRTVAVRNDEGAAIGEVFPERGVILSVTPGTTDATAILIEPLDADSFVLRAEGEVAKCSAYAVADLQYAIQIDPQHVRAHRLLLAITADQGKWTQALKLARNAIRLEPDDVWTKLKQAGVLLSLDRPDEAGKVLDGMKSLPNASPLVVAQAARLAGRVTLAQKTPDHQKAVEQFGEAIRLASPLLTKRTPAVQAAAREVTLDAHLGTALAIAKGTWQQKSRVIPKWISRADAVVKDFKGEEAERQTLELQLCRGALAVAAGSTEAIEPLPWVKRLLELRDRMGDTVADPWRRRQIDWEVGQGLSDALAAAQKRGDATDMLDNATLTAAYLERGAEQRELTAAERKTVGELMFRIGIMHSLQRGDHATAVTWFDRAIPLWNDNDGFERDGELGRLGESYVSMAISYWQVERREDAVTLSRRGVDLMVTAVDKSQLEERALAVAYGNLATMYAEQGDEQQSKNYAEMASRAEATGTVR